MGISEKEEKQRHCSQGQSDPDFPAAYKEKSGNAACHEKFVCTDKETDVPQLPKGAPVKSCIRAFMRRKVKIMQRISEGQRIAELMDIDEKLPDKKSQKTSGGNSCQLEKSPFVFKGNFP